MVKNTVEYLESHPKNFAISAIKDFHGVNVKKRKKKMNNNTDRLYDFINRFAKKSNDLSIWIRVDHDDKLPENLKKQLRELYFLQLQVEKDLNLHKLEETKNGN
jgi:hypothetical protein